ncbi:MAG TPA: Txe/YoeB family addiction module toxin [Acetobacteraceae bacterium]|nr:Txe/YoeB family addiction module toxin [Acetobacteraceae bacterium]
MNVRFTADAWRDLAAWAESDPKVLVAIFRLIEDVRRSPFQGLGKPEPLKNELSGWWSRRITREHRLVYRVTGKGSDQVIEIIKCRYHY